MTDLSALAERIDAELRDRIVPGRAEQERAYLKSDLVHYGVPVPAVRAVVKRTLRSASLERGEVIALADDLWSTPAPAVHERRAAAAELLVASVARLSPDDLIFVERLIRESRTWALVDVLAGSVAGPLVERESGTVETLDRWVVDPDFWIRRSALLAHLDALRSGGGDFERFGGYADAMLEEREFFIRKAIGWVLRDTSRKRPDLVAEWILPRAARASGVTVREAVKHLSAEQREAVLAARR